ncbi:MAG: UbiD family decarboxylase [Methanophagales archaeon ANME-1-THS]|nr:MAG: UbiD family decarboxylase [Methanophagales archaeon ANME-1-THS]
MRKFKDTLAREGRLIEVEDEVSSKYEVAARCRELEHRGLPILFHKVDGTHTVLMNLLGGRAMLAELLGTSADNLVHVLSGIPESGSERSKVRIVEDSPTNEVVKEPDLGGLPILTYFRGDAGAYITGGIIVAELDGVINASFHRMLVLDEHRVAARLVPSRHLYKMHRDAIERGEELKVGIAIGVNPLILLAAATRVPPGKEFEYASALKNLSLCGAPPHDPASPVRALKKALPKKHSTSSALKIEPVELFKLGNGIAIPHAEIAFEGVIGVERAKEGPFLDITGTYDRIREEPVITLTRMYHRKDPIYHAILPGGKEHRLLMGVPYEPLIYRAVEHVARVKNVFLTDGGCCYLHAVVQVKKDREGEPKNAIIAAFAAHPSLKCVVVVDEDIDLFNPSEVEYAIATRVRWDEDIMLIPGVRGSSLDPTAQTGLTTKVGIDATKELGEEQRYARVTG